MILQPAYGNDYKSQSDVLQGINNFKDFIINDITSRWDRKPINIEDMAIGWIYEVRYKANTRAMFVRITKDRKAIKEQL